MNKENEQWEYVDVNKLANVLAEEAWKEEVKAIHVDDLYEINVLLDPNGNTAEIVKTVRSYWQTTFWALRDGYLSLIANYCKTTDNEKMDNRETVKGN